MPVRVAKAGNWLRRDWLRAGSVTEAIRYRFAIELAAALLDGLVHRCHIVNIQGNSYRMRRRGKRSQAIHLRTAEAVRSEQAQIKEQS